MTTARPFTKIFILDLILLIALIFTKWTYNRFIKVPDYQFFEATLTTSEADEVRQLLQVFTRHMDQHKIVYFFGYGTMIGAFRHHGLIPWDDDIGHRLDVNPFPVLHLQMWKFHAVNGSRSFWLHDFRWPYIDIIFYEDSFNQIELPDGDSFRRDQVYPVLKRPFVFYDKKFERIKNVLWLNQACQFPLPESILTECIASTFSHRHELPQPLWRQKLLPCSQLNETTPLVYGTSANDTLIEKLMMGTRELHTFARKRVQCDGVRRIISDTKGFMPAHRSPEILGFE
ncbi:hypothetical protein Ciccas_002964 [Cichlidogyrus casuarinus]|uniref:LicD/FKTN/FKRP nucleotidyltransferase domain-containing protein n=1 Tax=Cichlidogyrus casuarinus TaxID=1844966 RepID=A0ABD2QG49_9PLAT